MAVRGPWVGRFRPRSDRPAARDRVLTASAARLDLADRKQKQALRKLREGWQADAWMYYDSVPELRYGVNYLANCMARMKLYPAAYPTEGEDDNPVPLADIDGVPTEVLAIATEAQRDLGNGRLALSSLLSSYSTNMTIAGECFLLGQEDPPEGEGEWTIRSTEEISVTDETYRLRQVPSGQGSAGDELGYIDLDPNTTVLSRIWVPHPKFRRLAISPIRAMLEDLETLLIYRRMIRAVGRSRIASRGLLVFPEEMELKGAEDDSEDPETADFLGDMIEAMLEGLSDEGVASAVAPILAQGPGEFLDKIRLIKFEGEFDKEAKEIREELVGVIGTGLDLPKEILTGKQDLNHWTAWQVDDDTFRAHVEPHVITGCDSLTGAYLRPYCEGKGMDPAWSSRILWWYDPSELVVHPDRSKDAEAAYTAFALSGAAYRRELGFSEEDAPTDAEIEGRMFQGLRGIPPNLLMEWARRADPTLIVPPITTPGTVPGIKAGGVDVGTPPAPAPGSPPPAGPADPAPSATAPPGSPVEAPEPADAGPPEAEPLLASARIRKDMRLSKRLGLIDRDLRTRLQIAANTALRRKLEQAGSKVISGMKNKPKDEQTREAIAHSRADRIAAAVGKDALTAAGIKTDSLLSNDWSALKDQFMGWTEDAQRQALVTAMQLGELDENSAAVVQARAALATGSQTAWGMLENALDHLAHTYLFHPDPNVGPTDWAELNPDTLVPTGTIRAAIAVSGGADPRLVPDFGVIPGSDRTIPLGAPVGQIGTGATISELLEGAGVEKESYEWDHGPALNPFEPHLDLDGTVFGSFDDEALANSGDFPNNQYFFPGDHSGCLCDFTALWVTPEGASPSQETGASDEASEA